MADASPPLLVTSQLSGERVRVVVAGDIDTATSGQLEAELARLVDAGARTVELDLAEVDFVDSWGLRVLIATSGQLAGLGGSLRVVAAGEQTQRLLTLTGMEDLLSGESTNGGGSSSPSTNSAGTPRDPR